MATFLVKPTNPKSNAVERSCIKCNRVFYCSASDVKHHAVKFCTKECKVKFMRGKNSFSWKPKPIRICKNCNKNYEIEAWRLKYANRGQFCSQKCLHLYAKGENAYNWRGGITAENHRIRTSRSMEKWRKAVLKKDNYKCVWCQSTERLEADHIKPFASYPDLRMEISNGRTLCRPCHIKTFTKAVK